MMLAKTNRWSELERQWLSVVESSEADTAPLMSVVDLVVKAGKSQLADTMSWAWLTTMKESRAPEEVLDFGRQLLVHLTDGEELREEILALYRQAHPDQQDLDRWVARSGLKSGKSVRRAVRYLDSGLRLEEGRFLIHRTEDRAAQIVRLDLDADEARIKTVRGVETMDIDRLIDEYDVADDNDFRVLEQLRPDLIAALLTDDPAALVSGIIRWNGNRMDRDVLKMMLVPRYLPAAGWADWWTKLRGAVKKSPNLRIEGRSPMFVVFDEAGTTPEKELWAAVRKAQSPREWLELIEAYLRGCKSHKSAPDASVLNKVQSSLVAAVDRFLNHKEPALAFATALVIERLAGEGLPVSTDVHGRALKMLQESSDPVSIVALLSDARLWPLATACVEQALPDGWPRLFAELILSAPVAQCETLARKVEDAGQGALLVDIAERALADPGRHTDALIWLWRGSGLKQPPSLPPLPEMLGMILGLVGPSRMSSGKAAGQSINEMRAKVRAGLAHKDYEQFRRVLDGLDDGMAMAIRRMLERAEGLGIAVQQDMSDILRARFAHLYLRPKVAPWDDESVLYFTERGLRVKQNELDELVNVKMRENAKAIGEAAAHGDLSENSEYKFALEERDLLRARVAKLNHEVSLAKVLEPPDMPTEHVGIGHRVRLRSTAGGQEFILTILGVGDGDLNRHVYSYQTPVARGILGRKTGDAVTVSVEGVEGDYRVEGFEPAI